MVTRVTIVAENDKPISLLGENAEAKVKMAWELMLEFINTQGNDKAYVEKVEVWDNRN